MTLHCDNCDKPLGDYLYGKGGVEEVAIITNKFRSIGLPDVMCFECLNTNRPKVRKTEKENKI